MKQVIVYMAMSLDGYLADQDGQLNWMSGDGSDTVNAGHYATFYDRIDTILLGHKTYRHIKDDLAPEAWPFDQKNTFVFTHQEEGAQDGVTFVNEDLTAFVNDLKSQEGGDIWVCGGANLIQQLLDADLVDQVAVTIMPILLGGGQPLFLSLDAPKPLKLVSSHSYNGMTDLVYERREN